MDYLIRINIKKGDRFFFIIDEWDTICREYAKSPVMDEFVNWLHNDMHDVESRDDVLTVLIHLGYLSYDRETRQCYLPNREVADEMESAIKDTPPDSFTPFNQKNLVVRRE
jgi:hypothetical protein